MIQPEELTFFPSFLHFSELIFSSSMKTNAHVSKIGSPANHRLNVYSENYFLKQRFPILLQEGQCPAEFSSSLTQNTCLMVSSYPENAD